MDDAGWLSEVLHVVWGFAYGEHESKPDRPAVLVPEHARLALKRVPVGVLAGVQVFPDRAPGAVGP